MICIENIFISRKRALINCSRISGFDIRWFVFASQKWLAAEDIADLLGYDQDSQLLKYVPKSEQNYFNNLKVISIEGFKSALTSSPKTEAKRLAQDLGLIHKSNKGFPKSEKPKPKITKIPKEIFFLSLRQRKQFFNFLEYDHLAAINYLKFCLKKNKESATKAKEILEKTEKFTSRKYRKRSSEKTVLRYF